MTTEPPFYDDEQRELFKAAVKEAIREWLNDMFAAFGKWTAAGFAAAALAALAYFMIFVKGGH